MRHPVLEGARKMGAKGGAAVLHLVRFGFLAIACALFLAPGASATPLALVPAPASMTMEEGAFDLNRRTTIYVARGDAGARAAADRFADLTQRTRDLRIRVREGSARDRAIVFERDASVAGEEAYRVRVAPDRIVVTASSDAGLYYGATTLWQLATLAPGQGAVSVPAVSIEDRPRLAWRGLMLDSVRHFQSVEFVKRFIDVMATHKFNVLHWHLTDDQGWRIEIRKYPRLTEVGAWRRPSGEAGRVNPRYGGFYTQDEIREIVAYAAERHITIVPEIEMPGHATAAVVAYPHLSASPNPPTEVSSDWGIFPNLFNTDEATFEFLQDVLTEVMELFPSEFIHVGGDEAVKPQWENNPRIQAQMQALGIPDEHHMQSWFITRIDAFLTSKGRRLIGWDEILEGGLAPGAAVMSWRGVDGAIAAARAGHDSVLSPWPLLYFDNRQSGSSHEPPGRGNLLTIRNVYEFDPAPEALTEAEREHIIGLQANLWAEHIRTEARMEAKAYPRAAAVAEAAWSPAHLRSWSDFEPRLAVQLARYEALGVGYERAAFEVEARPQRLAGGGAEVTLSTPFGMGDIRFSTDGGAPTQTYTAPIRVSFPATVHAQPFVGDRPLGGARAWRFDAQSAGTLTSQGLKMCNDSLVLNFEDDAPRAPGEDRAVFMVDVMAPCWIYEGAEFSGVTEIVAAVGQFPYSFQIGDAVNDIRFRTPSTPDGELEARLGGCDGERIAVIPLAAASANPGVTTIRAPLSAPIAGRHDVCFTFTARGVDPMYAIDWVRIAPAH